MAPKSSIRRDGERGQIYRDATGRKSPGLSAIVVLVDVFDNFGHVVLVLAELGGILEDVFFFLPILFRFILGALAAAGTLAGGCRLGLFLGLAFSLFAGRNLGDRFAFAVGLSREIGLEFFVLQRHDLCFGSGRRDGASRLFRLRQGLGIEGRAAFRTHDR